VTNLEPALDGPVIRPIGRERARMRTSDRVYEELVSAIRELRIPPGASLSETDLAEKLHVSRTPVREAIARLVDNGLVSVVPQVGSRVERIRLSDVEQARFVREALEVAAYEVACMREQRTVSVLRALIDDQKRAHAVHDVDRFFEFDEALHQEIFVQSGYAGVWNAVQPMKLQIDRIRRISLPDPDTVRDLIAEHTAIVDNLEAGNVEAGTKHVRLHARRVRDYAPKLREAHPDLFTD
jgi:DNA-binding GntR family transcriptional regulator